MSILLFAMKGENPKDICSHTLLLFGKRFERHSLLSSFERPEIFVIKLKILKATGFECLKIGKFETFSTQSLGQSLRVSVTVALLKQRCKYATMSLTEVLAVISIKLSTWPF